MSISLIKYLTDEDQFYNDELKRIQEASELLKQLQSALYPESQEIFLKFESNINGQPKIHFLTETSQNSSKNFIEPPLFITKDDSKYIAKNHFKEKLKCESGHKHLFDGLGSYERKKQKMQEDRRREYLEYLKERNRMEQERKLMSSSYIHLSNSPNQLKKLENVDKSIKQKKNTLAIRERCIIPIESNDFSNKFIVRQNHSFLQRSEEQAKVEQYKEDLRSQIEQKRKLIQEERERQHKEDILIEQKLEEQRKQVIQDLKQERDRIANRDEMMNLRSKRIKEYIENDKPSERVRSASYLYVRTAKVGSRLGKTEYRLAKINLNDD